MGLPRSSTATSGTFRYISRPEYWFVPGVTAQPEYVLVPVATPDPDKDALRALYAEFDEDDRALAEMGMGDYCAGLEAEDRE